MKAETKSFWKYVYEVVKLTVIAMILVNMRFNRMERELLDDRINTQWRALGEVKEFMSSANRMFRTLSDQQYTDALEDYTKFLLVEPPTTLPTNEDAPL